MRLLILGSNGQLGCSLKEVLKDESNVKAIYSTRNDFDITDFSSMSSFLKENKCDVVINCIAYTAVDMAEKNESEAYEVNSEFVGKLGALSKELNFKLIHISTDYVFDGVSSEPYTESDTALPQTVYGSSKLAGENVLFKTQPQAVVVRTSWLYSNFGRNFFLAMLAKARAGEPVKVVKDQIGSPTFAGDLAKTLLKIASSEKWVPGIYHYSNEGSASWYEFAKSIYLLAGADKNLCAPIESNAFKTLAKRPSFSVLDKSLIKKTFNLEIPSWEESLNKMFKKNYGI